jgi:MSHA biogenesis protein MshM
MPYLEHFGFRQRPFSLTPDRALFFPESHQPVLDAANYAVERGEPIVKIVGEVGTGKTLLCRLLVQDLVAAGTRVAFITVPQAEHRATLLAVGREFGLDVSDCSDAYQALADHLIAEHAAGRRAVLVVDEAQALDREGLETIRLLSNLETDQDKILQIVLFAQPELDRLLRQYSMRQLTQRITFNFTTRPFDARTGMQYMRYRVEATSVGPPPNDVFQPGAMKAIIKAADGIPRVINVLADRALLSAYAAGRPQVTRRDAKKAVADGTLGQAERPRGFRRWLRRLPA